MEAGETVEAGADRDEAAGRDSCGDGAAASESKSASKGVEPGPGKAGQGKFERAGESGRTTSVGRASVCAGVAPEGAATKTMLPHLGQAMIWPTNEWSRTLSRA